MAWVNAQRGNHRPPWWGAHKPGTKATKSSLWDGEGTGPRRQAGGGGWEQQQGSLRTAEIEIGDSAMTMRPELPHHPLSRGL